MKRLFAIAKTVLACLLPLASLAQPVLANETLQGVYYGNQGWEMNKVQALESWQGKKTAVVNSFTNWCNQTQALDNLFDHQLNYIWNNQNIPMITWEPVLCSSTPSNIEVLIAKGKYDTYIKNWSTRLKTFLSGADGIYNTSDDRRAYIRLGHEMNGNWYPWSAAVGGNNPNDYINMWKRTKAIFDSKGLDAKHLQWVWCVNNTDVGGYSAESYYPGDAYVDWIAIDGYNWGTSQNWSRWETPEQVFDPMVSRLRAITNKPLTITEVASTTATEAGTDITAKSQWLTDTFNYAIAQNINMIIYFNEDKETDWAIFGGTRGDSSFTYNSQIYITHTGYSNSVGASNFVAPNSADPRLITDAQFAGQ